MSVELFGGSEQSPIGEICAPCSELSEHNYTIGTFDLYLADMDLDGTPGDDVLVGNIVTGGFEDDVEDFDGFDPDGVNEPILVSVRSSSRLPFTTDEVTCENLKRFLGVDPTDSSGSARYGLNVVMRRKSYRVTLRHEMVCGHILVIRLHRAFMSHVPSYLFSPDSIHALTFQLRAFPVDSEDNPFGYWEFEPGICVSA